MIEEPLIESARIIRNKFNSLNETLVKYESDVKKVATYFFKISDDLKNIESGLSKNDTLESIKDKVILKLNDLEMESNKVCDKINKVNIELEKLKKEELDLYKVIKKRYPLLSDDAIKLEIQNKINI